MAVVAVPSRCEARPFKNGFYFHCQQTGGPSIVVLPTKITNEHLASFLEVVNVLRMVVDSAHPVRNFRGGTAYIEAEVLLGKYLLTFQDVKHRLQFILNLYVVLSGRAHIVILPPGQLQSKRALYNLQWSQARNAMGYFPLLPHPHRHCFHLLPNYLENDGDGISPMLRRSSGQKQQRQHKAHPWATSALYTHLDRA